jgi:predicted flap endonuclease-1-like 5' DNA nuclease
MVAGETYELRVGAQPVSPPVGDPESRPVQQRARLELRWLNGEPLYAPVILPLDRRGFPTHAWTGAAPAGTTRAEIRLVQPRGRGDLLAESVSLVRADLLPVPLVFLAEAPGELKVSDLRVAYDLPAPPAPPQLLPQVRVRTQALDPPIAPVARLSLTDLQGIGKARAGRLVEIGIDSIEKLAAAAPEDVARAMRGMGVSAKNAARFIEEARELLRF